MIRLYTLPGSRSCRYAKKHLINIGKPFMSRSMNNQPLSFDELKDILRYTENGLEDILADGKILPMLEEQGVNIEELTLREFHQYVLEYPTLICCPIAIGDGHMVVGYEPERYRVFEKEPRKERMESLNHYLEQLREEENKRLPELKERVTH